VQPALSQLANVPEFESVKNVCLFLFSTLNQEVLDPNGRIHTLT